MIQELLGGSASGVGGGGFNIGGGGGGGERKLFSSSNGLQNTNPSHHFSPSPSPTPSSSTPKATKAAGHDSKTSATTTSNAHDQNLRCPRCDSSNTKFCYYNNYNLTQPRHFCKTCRRYWTKGGALRNVPIGGGCRKNRSSSTTVVAAVTSTVNNNKSSGNNNTSKFKNLASEIGIIRPSGPFDHIYHDHGHHLQYSNPNIVWASPQNSHLLSLLRSATTATQFPNPNPNPSSAVKEEGRMVGTHMLTDPAGAAPTDLGLDPMNIGQVPSLGLCSSFWKNNQLGQENGFTAADGGGRGDHQNSGIQDLYQRLRLSSSTTANNNYYSTDRDNSAAAAAAGGALPLSNSNINNSNVLTSSSTAPLTSILDSAPVAAGAGGADPLMGYCWNPAFSSWSDHLPTTNGAYP